IAFQPRPPFGEMRADRPESPERAGQSQPALCTAAALTPLERGPHVVMLAIQALEPDDLIPAEQLKLGLLGQFQEEFEMALSRPGVISVAQPIAAILTHRLQKAVARDSGVFLVKDQRPTH